MQAVLRRVGEYIVRRCEYKDLIHVMNINMVSLSEHYSEYFFEELLREFPEAFLVAEINDSIVGYIMCKLEYGFSNFRKLGFVKKGHVVSIAVLKEHRNKGLGTALIQEAINSMVIKGCDEVYLEVRVSNEQAIKVYENIGLGICSRLRRYYRDGEDAYLMAKELR